MIVLKSHGFKFSRPEANYVFDVSYLKNPWREKEIRECKSARKRKQLIMDFMDGQDRTHLIAQAILRTILAVDTIAKGEHVKIAICCSAGEYRSPAVVELVSSMLKRAGVKHLVEQSKQSKI